MFGLLQRGRRQLSLLKGLNNSLLRSGVSNARNGLRSRTWLPEFKVPTSNAGFSTTSASPIGLQSIFQRAHRLLSEAKGFGKFFPKGSKPKPGSSSSKKGGSRKKGKESRGESSSSSSSTKQSKGAGSTGSNNGNPFGSFDPKNMGGPGAGGPGGSVPGWQPMFYVPILLYLIYSSFTDLSDGQSHEVTYQEFKTRYLEPGKVDKLVVLNKKKVMVHLLRGGSDYSGTTTDGGSSSSPSASSSSGGQESSIYFHIGSVDSFERHLEEDQRDMGVHPRDYVPVQYVTQTNWLATVASTFGPTILLIGVTWLILRNISGGMGGMGGMGGRGGPGGRNIFSIGKSNAKVIKPGENVKINFSDVAGLDEAKVEVMEFVKFLKNPDRFTRLGAKIPKGALLEGPPGTGKTLLAKATAGEANVPFFSISGSDFIEMFVGVGPSRVRDLFAEARKNAPCIIFIDEIDAVGRKRSKGGFSGGNDERENTLNQLLVEMDGFQTQEGVVVLAGTNRKDILDDALLRPGRFDRTIPIHRPDIRGRVQIFKVHLKPLKLGHDMDDLAQRLAALTPGFAGADIGNVCNEAALIAARAEKEAVELEDFEAATDRVIGGLAKSNNLMSKEQKELVAYHEAGHAVVGWMLEHAEPMLKVTIIPRTSGALGFAQYLPNENQVQRQNALIDKMCVALGGRAAEQVFFGEVSTGASDDIKQVTRIARAQVRVFGMSDELGHIEYMEEEGSFTRPFSEATSERIDNEVRRLVEDAYNRTVDLIKEHKASVEALAQELLKVEVVNHDQLVKVLGERPFQTDSYREFLDKHTHELADSKDDNDQDRNDQDKEKDGSTDQQDDVGHDKADKQDVIKNPHTSEAAIKRAQRNKSAASDNDDI